MDIAVSLVSQTDQNGNRNHKGGGESRQRYEGAPSSRFEAPRLPVIRHKQLVDVWVILYNVLRNHHMEWSILHVAYPETHKSATDDPVAIATRQKRGTVHHPSQKT